MARGLHLVSKTALLLLQAAIVREAGLPQQRVWRAELGGIVEATAGAGALSPCVVVVGQVVGLAGR